MVERLDFIRIAETQPATSGQWLITSDQWPAVDLEYSFTWLLCASISIYKMG